MKLAISIAKAAPEDAEELAQIKQTIWLATYQNKELGIEAEDILAKDFLCKERIAARAEHMKADDGINHTLVARVGSQIVAYGRAVRGDKFDEIITLYVLPEWQGKKIGSELLHHLLKWLGKHRDVMLEVVPFNVNAIRFYEKFGFKLGDKIPREEPVFPTGKDLPLVEMFRAGVEGR
jgi:GNAT superfamily N-acetyltransferase